MSIIIQNIVTDPASEKKRRKIVIIKQEVYKDVELFSYKHTEAAVDSPAKRTNAISADTTENLDGAVIARYVEFRNAQLRRIMGHALIGMDGLGADDVIGLDEIFAYNLELPSGFKDTMLRPLAEYIHRFLVWGALYDWYSQFGLPQAAVYGSELDQIEEDINSILRGPSIVKRPMQPFGPAYKFM